MKEIKVLGSGCANCRNTESLIRKVAEEQGVEVSVSKVEDPAEMLRYRIMATPAVVIDEAVVHTGGVPSRGKIGSWLK